MSNEKITLTRKALLTVLGRNTGMPNPEDGEPRGPWGPIIRLAEQKLAVAVAMTANRAAWVTLNPQPEPPKPALALAAAAVEHFAAAYELVSVLPPEVQKPAVAALGQKWQAFIGDCGNEPHKFRIPHPRPWPWPWPDPRRTIELEDVVVLGAYFQLASQGQPPGEFQKNLAAGGEQLLNIGLNA